MVDGWLPIEEAPLGELGHLWTAKYPDRVDATGEVLAYGDGERFVASSWLGVPFTHWHPLPKPPNPSQPSRT